MSLVRVPFESFKLSGERTGSGFEFYCDCRGTKWSTSFKVRTTEDPTVPLFECGDCGTVYLVSDFESAPVREV